MLPPTDHPAAGPGGVLTNPDVMMNRAGTPGKKFSFKRVKRKKAS